MGVVGRIGRAGPQGLMPNPKAVLLLLTWLAPCRKPRPVSEYRLDRTNIIHCPIGKVSFIDKLEENAD